MRIYVGFDDTDTIDSDRGTGKLARWFEGELPEGCRLWGVVRQQLLVDAAIPYTSHNSSACTVVDCDAGFPPEALARVATEHLKKLFIPGSDPGLCVAWEDGRDFSSLIDFGRKCTHHVVTQEEALLAARGFHLSGHGGTSDGIIGAAAAVGLTALGWGGRFIEFGRLRDFPEEILVSDLEDAGIGVVSLDREACALAPGDTVCTKGWLRPRLWGGRPLLPVLPVGKRKWETIGEKKRKKDGKEGRQDGR